MRLLGRVSNLVDLDQNLARGQELLDARSVPGDEILEKGVAPIATRNPDDPGWRATALLDLDEIAIFCNDNSVGLSRVLVNLRILRC